MLKGPTYLQAGTEAVFFIHGGWMVTLMLTHAVPALLLRCEEPGGAGPGVKPYIYFF